MRRGNFIVLTCILLVTFGYGSGEGIAQKSSDEVEGRVPDKSRGSP